MCLCLCSVALLCASVPLDLPRYFDTLKLQCCAHLCSIFSPVLTSPDIPIGCRRLSRRRCQYAASAAAPQTAPQHRDGSSTVYRCAETRQPPLHRPRHLGHRADAGRLRLAVACPTAGRARSACRPCPRPSSARLRRTRTRKRQQRQPRLRKRRRRRRQRQQAAPPQQLPGPAAGEVVLQKLVSMSGRAVGDVSFSIIRQERSGKGQQNSRRRRRRRL